jgi:Tfp pilus assembly protein PilF
VGRAVVLLLVLSAHAGATQAPSGAAGAAPALGDILQRPVPLRDGIGRASDPVSTSSPQAQAMYNQGIAYLHSYGWIEAARSFNEALRLDSKLALAYVGLSEAFGELGLPERAREASGRARALASGVTDRELFRIALRASQLDAVSHPRDASAQVAYRKKLDEILVKYPDDVELLLLVGQAQDPSAGGHGMGAGSSSLDFYQRALGRSPDYFATHHLLTHAYENINRIDLAVVHAERYARAADGVPHAHHMYGHVLRRADRMSEAIGEFEKADRLALAYLQAERIPPQYDWHYGHNLNLLGTSYQYAGRMGLAEQVLRRSFEMKSIDRAQDLNRKEWPTFLLARGRGDEALAAARTLAADPVPLVAAMGHLLVSRALQASKRADAAAVEGNLALGRMRAMGPLGGTLLPDFELTQGEFLLRTGNKEGGRAMLRDAAAKLLAQTGPDAWVQTLFSLEAVSRTARELGDWTLAAEFAERMRLHDSTYPGTSYALALIADHRGDQSTTKALVADAIRRWSGADSGLPELRDAQRILAALSSRR